MLHAAAASRIRKPVGIDLGTTNSVVALLDPTGSELLVGRDERGRCVFPSLVGHDPATDRLVAGPAAASLPGATLPLSSVKRFMGLDRRFPLGPKSLSPAEASALVLSGLREWMARGLADPAYAIDQAVVTMPAYFNHNQIEATRHAGELAGYEVLELLHEPTAAAIYYSWAHDHGDACYLVYDLGGGTFDVSVIRRRLGDYEVLAVSGDPFLGGDDFDRSLASHLVREGTWKWGDEEAKVDDLFDPTRPDGAVPFARLVRVAEGIKSELTTAERVERFVPRVLAGPDGRALSLEVAVTRAAFDKLIRDKIDRTIDCCHEALARAKERGVRLADVDHVVLAGGSSRVPLVRQRVRAAFANPAAAERARGADVLSDEPDLCVAYGAALRAAGHGTRYLFPGVELHLTGPSASRETAYHAAGVVRSEEVPLDGASVRIRAVESGLVDEVFLDRRGGFSHEVELTPEADNALEWAVCDPDGVERARLTTSVRHRAAGRPLGRGVLPTQMITKPLSIEVLTRSRQRVKQVVAPVGATLPATFRATCRTSEAGRIVLPIYEENRVVHQLVLDGGGAAGTPVDVEFSIDARHAIAVRVRVRAEGRPERVESATIEPPPPPRRPTRVEVDETRAKMAEVSEQLTGRYRSRVKARAEQLHAELLEALSYDDEPRAIQRLAELRELLAQAEQARAGALEPAWQKFAQLVRRCLDLGGQVAEQTGRDLEELTQHVRAQERYAEQAYEEQNQTLYRECWENLDKYAGYLAQLLRDAMPRPSAGPSKPPEVAAKEEVEAFRGALSRVWKEARAAKRADLEAKLAEIAKQASSFTQRLKGEPVAVLRDARKLGVEVDKIARQLGEPEGPKSGDGSGLLEGAG